MSQQPRNTTPARGWQQPAGSAQQLAQNLRASQGHPATHGDGGDLARNLAQAYQGTPGSNQAPPQTQDLAASINWAAQKFEFMSVPEQRRAYESAAKSIGINDWDPKSPLRPLVMTQSTTPVLGTALHPNIPVSLNANIPSRTLRYYFQDPAFLTRVTSTVTGLRIKAEAQPEPGVLLHVDPRDYIYVSLKYEGIGDLFMQQPISLSEFSGPGALPYLFDILPAVKGGGALLLDVSIIPPNWDNQNLPPFIERVSNVAVSFHSDRILFRGN